MSIHDLGVGVGGGCKSGNAHGSFCLSSVGVNAQGVQCAGTCQPYPSNRFYNVLVRKQAPSREEDTTTVPKNNQTKATESH